MALGADQCIKVKLLTKTYPSQASPEQGLSHSHHHTQVSHTFSRVLIIYRFIYYQTGGFSNKLSYW